MLDLASSSPRHSAAIWGELYHRRKNDARINTRYGGAKAAFIIPIVPQKALDLIFSTKLRPGKIIDRLLFIYVTLAYVTTVMNVGNACPTLPLETSKTTI